LVTDETGLFQISSVKYPVSTTQYIYFWLIGEDSNLRTPYGDYNWLTASPLTTRVPINKSIKIQIFMVNQNPLT